MLNTEIRRDERGAERCARKIMKAVPNVMGDDSKGYHNVEAICNAPITVRVSDNVKGCPNCDKEPAVGNVKPRTINSNSIALTPAELKECGLAENPVHKPAVEKKIVKKEKKAVEAKVNKAKKDVVEFDVALEILERQDDVPTFLLTMAIQALDKLPVTNFAESKRLLKLQEKLESLLRV